MATVSSHILDSIVGTHAAGIKVEFDRLSGSAGREQLFEVTADEEGRIAVPVDIDPASTDAHYELVFHSADYFAAQGIAPAGRQIMNVVVVRMNMPDPGARYHIPLVLSPHSYTIWWSG
ncbi:MAG: hydroxyisourate hydrolase [Gammaproteobacteria bacterium]